MTPEDHADFVRRFENWWQRPDPKTLGSTLAEDVVLIQPTTARTKGLTAAQRSFERLLALTPDLHAAVHRWAGHENHVFIEFTMTGTLEGKTLSWENVDRFTLNDDGLATERVNFHDSVAVAAKLISHPQGWPQIYRSGLLKR
ncbi:MAG: nuclear transport factor 2 family protein [Thermoleophilaceae bacterium]|nr:nuclear transport factor 2 family protein [Thermoleophilaceae bacterium]